VPILELKDVSVTLGGQPILRDVTFAIEAGEIVAIIGPNGSGKTVLLKAILGIVPHDGTIRGAPARPSATSRRRSTPTAACR